MLQWILDFLNKIRQNLTCKINFCVSILMDIFDKFKAPSIFQSTSEESFINSVTVESDSMSTPEFFRLSNTWNMLTTYFQKNFNNSFRKTFSLCS